MGTKLLSLNDFLSNFSMEEEREDILKIYNLYKIEYQKNKERDDEFKVKNKTYFNQYNINLNTLLFLFIYGKTGKTNEDVVSRLKREHEKEIIKLMLKLLI